ncbi:hypothetical protein [Vibrio aestuarianus]|uniref:hypothetical protein n=1 Tax=Vibrio aestuarianus TaxID=28171 RepID=UPI00237CD03D|nr:hypothetical protein [Vibrio aestuarianus]MDE1266132.1 hypothetical protein [Vibrio aestuarianus]MDE1298341.1 hypothetical protein [Vibrio aestuarianus]
MKKRKFLSEFGVNICSSGVLFMPSDQVHLDGSMNEESLEISKNSHIYLITRRPSAYFVNDSLKYDNDTLEVEIGYKIEGKEHKFKHKQMFKLTDGAVNLIIGKYPHREILSVDDTGETVRRLPASMLSVPVLNDLEVLYIGQAFGNGSRTAHERLKSHSTLQKILAESSVSYPDSEVSILMFQFEQYRLVATLDGNAKGVIDGNEDNKRFLDIKDNPLTEKQQIGLVEASLIRYFQPHYNEKFKIKFPSPKVKVLKKCFELDFSGLIVEVNTEDLGFTLNSEKAESKHHHIASIDIVSDKSRAGFFFITLDAEVQLLNDVIQ